MLQGDIRRVRGNRDVGSAGIRTLAPRLLVAMVSLLAGSHFARVQASDPPWIARGSRAMVATDSPHASAVGREILRAGGNAIDATVAISFALGVTRPYSTGMGGGGFMIARLADGRFYVQDFRETAPGGATPDMYTRGAADDGSRVPPSQYGHLAVGVPGLVAGRCDALARHGTMPLKRLLAPAIRLAREGFPVDAHYVETTTKMRKVYDRYPALKVSCPYVLKTHLVEGRLPSVGKILSQPALARLLEGIAEGGAEFFYRGPVAAAIAREMRRHGGLITESDLAGYRVRERKPIRTSYRGFEIIGMPPPSSGGIALAQTLNILDRIGFAEIAKRDRNLAVHYQVEAMKHAFADRARWVGDADFADVPTQRLVSGTYADLVAKMLDPSGPRDLDSYGSRQMPDDSGTCHSCVVDRWGNVVVSSETINTEFGSFAAVDEWGLILNNEMDDFTSRPGEPNAFGLVQSERNAIAAGKRPLSSMTPTIVLKGGEPMLMLGASGGPRIISSVLNVLLGVTDLGRSLEEAMMSPRPHHQWRPDEVYFDAKPPEALRSGLTGRGHRVSDRRRAGVVQAILRTSDGWIGACDPKKGGRPAGY
ncbi:MAG: gamma-glutamyltransferase [Planctomycetes bacterium]|nr:gamma-glutamyltransferase [Planctomycetota bacterium]